MNTEVSFDVENDPELGNAEGSKVYSDSMPTSNADNGLALSDMRGLSYDDPQWDAFLDRSTGMPIRLTLSRISQVMLIRQRPLILWACRRR